MARIFGTFLARQVGRLPSLQVGVIGHLPVRVAGAGLLGLAVGVGWAPPVLAQSSGCDSYVTAVQTLEAAKFRFHADLRGVAAADGTGAGAFQFWVNPATAEWILLELGVGTEEEGLRGCIKLSGRDYKQYDIGLTPEKE